MSHRTMEPRDENRVEPAQTTADLRQTIDDLRTDLAEKDCSITLLRSQLAAAVSENRADRQSRCAALNLMEDAIQARMAQEQENTARRSVEDELRQADRRKDEFLATLAHELRTPLSPIRNSLYILRLADRDRATIDRVCATMERQVNHMVRLVDDLMEVSRITRGCIELRKEVVDLASVIHDAIDSCRPQLEEARHQLAISIPAVPLFVDADRVRLTQVINNLLSNSIKYMDEGGQIWVTAARDENFARIVVGDTGIGIPPEMLERVFDLFTQLNSARNRVYGGLGIGLSLVRSLIEMHGGSIKANSEGPGLGTEFVLRLPLAMSLSQRNSSRPEVDPASFVFTGSILVVDDSADSATSLGMLLTAMGAQVHVVNDGAAALQDCATCPPSIVVCDIGMPLMNGYEVAQRIRQMPGCENTVLVALTGWGQEMDRRQSREAGFHYHLVKPVDLDALTSILSSVTAPKPAADR